MHLGSTQFIRRSESESLAPFTSVCPVLQGSFVFSVHIGRFSAVQKPHRRPHDGDAGARAGVHRAGVHSTPTRGRRRRRRPRQANVRFSPISRVLSPTNLRPRRPGPSAAGPSNTEIDCFFAAYTVVKPGGIEHISGKLEISCWGSLVV